ncbi:FtsX-like permease family protein [Pseudoponticoccus marisrubri]|uniref:ABC transporter permease n=1 Tax=Pseudoponticoccus marisrubri TaxID=1685382 RepID=A0A0W7WMT7_9RHOB|nr:FtsX-like permease family protein [Pseudoponticoccus marisrubri]KUF11812.1 ABC transporter permease [Pseudoponticoccus marisrubri]
MIRVSLAALLSHWRRNLLQLFALLAGLALATALWSGVQAINGEARASYDAAAATLGEGRYDQLVPRQGDALPVETYVSLRRAGWRVTPIVEGRLGDVRVIGFDPVTAPAGFGGLEATAALAPGDTGAAKGLFGTADTARRLEGLAPVTVTRGVAPGVAVGDIGVVLGLLDRDGLSRLLVLPEQPIGRPPLEKVAPELRLRASQQTADIAQLTDSFHLNLTAFGFLSFAVGLFIVHSTIGLAFEQRRGVVRTMRALGVPLRVVIGVTCAEMLALALLGGALGIVLGYALASVLLPDVAATLRGLYGAQVSGTLALRPEWWLSGMALALIGTAAALSRSLWQIARMPILASARPRAWAMSGAAGLRGQALAALVLLVAAAILGLVAEGLVAGFALLACLLIGAALALPVVLSRVLALIEARSHGPILSWFWADTRQQLSGLSLALMALLLAVSANIGVSTMVSSFRLTFVSFLDQRLAPELYVEVDTAAQGAALDAYLRGQGLEVLPLYSVAEEVAGLPAQVFGVRVGPTYRDSWAFLDAGDAPWDAVAAGEAVVVNEQLARRADLWVGDRVTLAPGVSRPIAGVVGDYGNPRGQVVLSEPFFATLYPEVRPLRFGVRTQDPDALRRAIEAELGVPQSAMTDQAVIKRASLDVFERTFLVTGALNVLTLGVAGFAILMSLLTLADMRVPQLAPVWALGLTRRRLGWLELARAVVLALCVFLCALPLGLALAWVLLSIVNVAAFGWQLPMFLFPVDYARLGLYAALAALVAAAWPAFRLMRTPAGQLLKVFSHER